MKNLKVFSAVILALLFVAVIVAACNQTPPVLESQGLAPVRISNPVRMDQTLNVAGDTRLASDLTVVGDITAASIVTDGNATLTSLSTTGNITDDGALTVGGGFGSTGCTLSTAGVLQCDDEATIGGAATVTGVLSANGGAAITGSLTISGYQQYPVSYWDMDGVNGAMAAHGLPGAPTYPHCMLYTPVWTTATVYISAANATSVTLAMPLADGTPYTGDPLAVRCSAVYVP